MAESPFKITQSDDGLSVRCEFDAHYVNDEDAHRICGYIDDLRDENARLRSCLSDDAENARMIMAENAKLRELCATVIDDWMSKVCPSFPFCEFGGEYQDCTDETCGNQIYRQMARERGIEVDDA